MAERETYRTPQRPRGARAAGADPRPGEGLQRGGQKSHLPDPDGMQPTERERKNRQQEGADFHQPVRGNEPPDGEGPGDSAARGEDKA